MKIILYHLNIPQQSLFLLLIYKIVLKQFGVGLNFMKFTCHCHYVILLDIATVCYIVLCDRVQPHALYVHSQPSCSII